MNTWNEWNGGLYCPPKANEPIEVRYRSGIVISGRAYQFDWRHFRLSPSDIVEYRLTSKNQSSN